ncbi:MAG: histidinol phosphate phosphatase domain-containing protein, partial [Methanobrevibacter sp.]
GHVANVAREVGNKLLVNTDTHSPDNLITFEKSYEIALGAGLSEEEVKKAIVDNPRELLKNKGIL